MSSLNLLTIIIFFTGCIFMSAAAKANNMVGNGAYGLVAGDIVQQTRGDSEIYIGSIVARQAVNNRSRGIVNGSVIVTGQGGHVYVGSIISENARNIEVSGHVRGDILMHGEQSGLVLSIGTVQN